jgi:coenzyme F420-reducing hydrogenase alpha subunit
MLEAGVEYWHHRHIVAEARENIREEIKENHEAAQKNVGYVRQSIEGVKENVKTLHVLMTRPKDFHGSLANTIQFTSFHDAAWRTARDTGALSYMPYQEVQRYSDLYMMEQMVTQKAIDTAERSFRAGSPVFMGYDVTALPDAEYMDMLRQNASSQLDLTVLTQYVQQFDNQCVEELKR